MTVYNYEDLFENDPSDSANVIFKIPEEFGWKDGDIIDFEVENDCLILRKKDGTN